jgi:hypothetical protein
MNSLDLAIENLTSPPVLAFVLGALAVILRSDLRLPDPIHTWISTYLLLAIGLKGGHSLKGTDISSLVMPATLTIAFGIAIPTVVFFVTTKLLKLNTLCRINCGTLRISFGCHIHRCNGFCSRSRFHH